MEHCHYFDLILTLSNHFWKYCAYPATIIIMIIIIILEWSTVSQFPFEIYNNNNNNNNIRVKYLFQFPFEILFIIYSTLSIIMIARSINKFQFEILFIIYSTLSIILIARSINNLLCSYVLLLIYRIAYISLSVYLSQISTNDKGIITVGYWYRLIIRYFNANVSEHIKHSWRQF